MREREEPSFFDSNEDYNRKRNNNRQAVYENKVCRKLINRLFEKGNPDRDAWLAQLEASSEPLTVLQELMGRFCLSTHRLQSWSINDLLGPPSKLANLPLWKEFAQKVAEQMLKEPSIKALIEQEKRSVNNSITEGKDSIKTISSKVSQYNNIARI